MIELNNLVVRNLYKVDARNFSLAVWTGEYFIGIRQKFNSTFLSTEYHWDTDPNFGTCKPLEDTGLSVPKDIELICDVHYEEDGNKYFKTYKPLLNWLQDVEVI